MEMINPLCTFSSPQQAQNLKAHSIIVKVELIIIRDYRAFMNKELLCHHVSAIYKK